MRKLLFRSNVVLSVLTERRSTRPYGLLGKLWSFEAICKTVARLLSRLHFANSVHSKISLCWPGGEDGAAGLNLLHRADGRILNLGAKNSISLQPGVKLHHVWKKIYHVSSIVIIMWILLCCMNTNFQAGFYFQMAQTDSNPLFTCVSPPTGHVLPLHPWRRGIWKRGGCEQETPE